MSESIPKAFLTETSVSGSPISNAVVVSVLIKFSFYLIYYVF